MRHSTHEVMINDALYLLEVLSLDDLYLQPILRTLHPRRIMNCIRNLLLHALRQSLRDRFGYNRVSLVVRDLVRIACLVDALGKVVLDAGWDLFLGFEGYCGRRVVLVVDLYVEGGRKGGGKGVLERRDVTNPSSR